MCVCVCMPATSQSRSQSHLPLERLRDGRRLLLHLILMHLALRAREWQLRVRRPRETLPHQLQHVVRQPLLQRVIDVRLRVVGDVPAHIRSDPSNRVLDISMRPPEWRPGQRKANDVFQTVVLLYR